LDGNELENAIATSYNCRIATPLGSGAWMTADEGRGASVFGDPKKNQAYDYRIHQSVKAKNDRGTTRIFLSTNNPAQTYNPCNPSLGEVGGIPIESIGNMPPGNYPNIEPNQWVLVAFINSSFYPIVIASLPSEEEWEAVLKN
jgi:phosphomannomutase